MHDSEPKGIQAVDDEKSKVASMPSRGTCVTLAEAFSSHLFDIIRRHASCEYPLDVMLELRQYYLGFLTSSRIAFETIGDEPSAYICQKIIDELNSEGYSLQRVAELVAEFKK